jgi:hypothetical protein
MTFHAIFIDGKQRRSPVAFRRERIFYKQEQAAIRCAAVPQARKIVDQEKRWKKARRAAVAAITWALFDGFSRDEIAGAVVKVLRKNKDLVFDHDALHRECLTVLNRATCQ